MDSIGARGNSDGDARQAIEDLIQLWVDLSCIRGEASLAYQLKPYLIRALSEPGDSVHRLIEASPALKSFLAGYIHQPIQLRHRLTSEILSNDVCRQALDIFRNGMTNLAVMNQRLGITFAEAERRIAWSFEHELSSVTLGELLGRLREPPDKIDVHALLCNLGLAPGSIAGADKRLRGVLTQRMKTFSGNVPYYEQDLKATLWECSKSKQLAYELGDLIKREGDLLAQIRMLLRMAQRQERQPVRSILVKVLRRIILAFPDVHQEVKTAKQGDRVVPLTEEMQAVLPAPQSEGIQDNILDMLAERGIDIEHLDNKELSLLAQELDRMRLGKTRKEYYKQNKNKMEQRFKHLCSKLNTQTQ